MCMISWMICPPCEITDQFSIGTQNCFSTLFYTPYHSSFLACNSRLRSLILTLKQPPKMHHCQTKNQKITHWGRGIPPPQTSPPSAPSAPRLSHLRRSAFPFLFIYESNTVCRDTTKQLIGGRWACLSMRWQQAILRSSLINRYRYMRRLCLARYDSF